MRLKKVTASKVVQAVSGVAIVAVIYLFTLIAGISRMEAQTKSEGKQSLDKIIQSLKALDTAYASGNTAEAQSDFDTANSEWKSVSSKISARESREVQLLFESIQPIVSSRRLASYRASTQPMFHITGSNWAYRRILRS
jgi:hypothetical protein